MPAIAIRLASAQDVPRLLEIYNHYVVNTPITFDMKPMTLAERTRWFKQFRAQGRHRLWVAHAGSHVLGYAATHQFRVKAAYDTTVETSVYCAPEAMGRGIGTALYASLFEALRGEDIRSFIAGITLPNLASELLHRAFGFEPAGTMHAVGRKFEEYWDVAWYERLS
jgi:phosphinothricin acetyltransferase